MTYFNFFAVLARKVMRRRSALIAPALVFAVVLLIGSPSFADESRYRVLLARVPGADQIEAGNILAGIKILEGQLNQAEQGNSGDIWSTLCAAHIINFSLNQAELACTKAVQIDPSYYALNNRGVLRVYKGDLVGAREDFAPVRSLNVEAYLNRTKTTNDRLIAGIRLIAANNFVLANQLSAKRTAALAKRTAAVEDLFD